MRHNTQGPFENVHKRWPPPFCLVPSSPNSSTDPKHSKVNQRPIIHSQHQALRFTYSTLKMAKFLALLLTTAAALGLVQAQCPANAVLCGTTIVDTLQCMVPPNPTRPTLPQPTISKPPPLISLVACVCTNQPAISQAPPRARSSSSPRPATTRATAPSTPTRMGCRRVGERFAAPRAGASRTGCRRAAIRLDRGVLLSTLIRKIFIVVGGDENGGWVGGNVTPVVLVA